MSKISGAQIALGLQPGKAMSPYDMYRLKNYIEHSERENARRKSELEAIKTQKEEQRKLEVVQKTVMAQHDSRKTDNTATTIKTPTLAPVVEKTTFEPPKLGNYLQPLPVVKQTEQSGVSQNGAMLAQVANKVKEYENALSEYESLGSQLGYHENPSKRIDENWQIVLDWYEMPVPGQDSPKQNERFRELGSQLSTGMEDYKKRRALLDENYMSPEEVYRKTQYNEAVVLATTESEKDLDFAYKSRVVMGDHGYSTLGNDLKYLTDEKKPYK